ncbi:hypothetical protein LRM64_20430 [Prescottella equi]|nr:hypothetical protein [Prescottella equi]MCU7531580.1 hypothetical protein [Prescottella equi]MCU7536062.1 hypothetical protein [Prescottella equi]ORL17595.1 hypothetical protein A6I86_23430 [Prescottella equi]ORL33181.1 hypothetical protein A6I87_22405 [Prescottella equi]
MSEYRIVRDAWAGYEVQVRRWWLPFWVQKGFTNTFSSIEDARDYALNGDVVERGRTTVTPKEKP